MANNKSKDKEYIKVEWQSMPVVDSEKSLKIEDNGRHDGANHDFVSHTVTEGEIRQLAYKYKDINQEIGTNFFREQEDKCQAIQGDISRSRDTFENIIKNARATFDQIKNNFQADLKNLVDNKKQEKQKLDIFKLDNKLSTFANIASSSSFLFMYFIFAILATIEIVANSYLIGSVVSGGVNEGMIVSVLVAVVNVILTALIGYFVLKHIHNVNGVKKGLAYLVMSIWVPLVIIYMNWCVGALRTLGQHFSQIALETRRSSLGDPEAAKVLQAEPTEIGKVLQDALVPWNLPENVNWDLTGIILVVIGISFAVASLVKAYLIDDTYPGYGKVSRAYVNAKNAVKDKCTDLRKECTSISEDCTLEKDEIKNKLKENIDDFWVTTNWIEKEGDSYNKIMKKNHDNVLHILDEYQEIVRQTRKAKNREIPDRFKNKGNFYSKEDLDCTKTFEVNMHYHFDDDRREEETNKLTTNLTDSDTYAQEEIRKLTKLMSEESSEVEKEYDPKK